MPQYQYKAVNESTGERVENNVEVENKTALYRHLKNNGERIVSVREVSSERWFNWSAIQRVFARVSTHEKITFAHNLSSMLSAGLTATRALSVLRRQTNNPKFAHILERIEGQINEGKSFHDTLDAFPDTFSPLFVAMVQAGEESGTLAHSLEIVSRQMDQTYQLKRKVRGAMIYPAIVLVIMAVIGVLMLVYIVPTLQSTFENIGAELPPTTQFIIGASNAVQTYPYHIFGALVVGVGLCVYVFRTSWGKRGFEFMILRVPVVGDMAREVNAARTTRTLSSLLTSGVSMLQAIGITRDVLQNTYYKDIMDDAEARVEQGENISVVFQEHEGLYPVFVGEMVSVGEETGKIDAMLLEVAEFYEDDVSQRTKNLSTIVEPLLMVVIGIAVGFFAFSMLTPMYSLVDNI